MATLAEELRETGHVSALLRSARRVDLVSTDDFIRLAVARGCYHYSPGFPPLKIDPGLGAISNEELVALLLLGSNEYEPFAIRCAAQLMSSCDAKILATVARRERVERSIAHIATIALEHDVDGERFWNELLEYLGPQIRIPDGIMPHWSRFVSQTGVTSNGRGSVNWLHCHRARP
jgi:hypothetical protein